MHWWCGGGLNFHTHSDGVNVLDANNCWRWVYWWMWVCVVVDFVLYSASSSFFPPRCGCGGCCCCWWCYTSRNFERHPQPVDEYQHNIFSLLCTRNTCAILLFCWVYGIARLLLLLPVFYRLARLALSARERRGQISPFTNYFPYVFIFAKTDDDDDG